MMRNIAGILGAVVALLLMRPALAMPLTVVLDFDQGWYNDDGVNEARNTNYLAGHCSEDGCGFQFAEYRNFFLFDLSSVDRPIRRASLFLWLPENGFVSPTGSETYELFHAELRMRLVSAGAWTSSTI